MGSKERHAPRAAIAQALRFHFHCAPIRIAELLKIKPQTVTGWTVAAGDYIEILPWWKRQFQNEAIEAAQKLLSS